MPLLERVRVEVYIPDLSDVYRNLLTTFEEEFTFAWGGCTVVSGLQGSYLANAGHRVPDRINLIYTDLPISLATDFEVLARYTYALRAAVINALAEESVLVTVSPIYHVVSDDRNPISASHV